LNKPKGYPPYVTYNPKYKRFLVTVPKEKIDKINKFAVKLAKKKMEEAHYKVDGNSLVKRLVTGLTGEAAVEELLGIKIIDWTIGNSRKYNVADIQELGIGVKTVEYGLHPLVPINPAMPQIICVKMSENEVIICGLASIKVLKKYQDFSLVRAKGARIRGTKSGFFGFKYLDMFSSLKQLKKILNSRV